MVAGESGSSLPRAIEACHHARLTQRNSDRTCRARKCAQRSRRGIFLDIWAQHVADRPYVDASLIGDPSLAPSRLGDGSAAVRLAHYGSSPSVWRFGLRVNGLKIEGKARKA